MDKLKRVTPFSKGGSHYKPPGGVGIGGPARGSGWGGEARAPGDMTLAPKFGDRPPIDPARLKAGKMEAKEYRERLRAKLERVEAAYDRALDADNPALGLAAAKQIEDRVFGQAKQIVETQTDTRSEAELMADIERKKREAGLA